MSKTKEAVGNLGEEEMNFLKHVRLTRDDTRRDANMLFSTAHQTRERDIKLMEKLFTQADASMSMTHNLLKEASAEDWDEFEKVKVSFNVHHFFEGGHDLTAAQKRFPELLKVARIRPTVQMKKTPPDRVNGDTAGSNLMSGADT